jgi:hypothetical protein
LLALAVVLLVTGACSSGGVDRDDAIARVIDEGAGRISPDQASCYVDRVLDEIGSAPLRPGAEITPEQNAKITSVRVDCIGVANLGAGAGPTTPERPPEGGLPGPRSRGDSPELDALWDACAAGFGQACDDLGATCGRRTREVQCAAIYPAPGVVLPSAAQPTTTVPPPPP